MFPMMALVTGAHAEGWSSVGGTPLIKRCLWASFQNRDGHLFLPSWWSLLSPEFCCRMTSVGLLVFIGGFIGVCQLVKLLWRCWRGFRQFVLSAFWQVDLRSYGEWAGKRDIRDYYECEMPALTRLPSLWCV